MKVVIARRSAYTPRLLQPNQESAMAASDLALPLSADLPLGTQSTNA